MIGLLFLLSSCGGDVLDDLARDALVQDFGTLAECDVALFSELATACRLGMGIEAAASGDDDAARLACGAIRHEIWRNECNLRVAQELGRVGRVELALRHCAVAGSFQEICVTQTAWTHPRWDSRVTAHFADEGSEAENPAVLGPDTEGVATAIDAFVESARTASSTLSGAVFDRAMDQVIASAWFNVYFGSGSANPELAQNATGDHMAPAHTAFALEAVRILSASGVGSSELIADEVRRVWSGAASAPQSKPVESGRLVGRYSPPIEPDGAAHLRRSATWLGGRRLVGDSRAEDLEIAIVEAMFFNKNIPVEALTGWLEDERDLVRWTAARLYAQIAGKDDTKVQEMLESNDSVLTGMVWKALVVDTDVPGGGLP